VEGTNVEVRFVDVNTEEELIEALNAFSGALLVFDGHGINLGANNIAGIMIGGRAVDAWKLRTRARVPPLVWLSACDTHPIDGSHASAGLGFLVAGASSVLATMLPLNAVHAAMIVARMMFRLDEYISAVTLRGRRPVRWSTVVSGMLRMSYASDLVRISTHRVAEVARSSVRDEAIYLSNMWINTGDPSWFERLVHHLATRTKTKESDIRRISRVQLAWSDVPRYVQLGNPESVLVV
jgi:hypothetical protein